MHTFQVISIFDLKASVRSCIPRVWLLSIYLWFNYGLFVRPNHRVISHACSMRCDSSLDVFVDRSLEVCVMWWATDLVDRNYQSIIFISKMYNLFNYLWIIMKNITDIVQHTVYFLNTQSHTNPWYLPVNGDSEQSTREVNTWIFRANWTTKVKKRTKRSAWASDDATLIDGKSLNFVLDLDVVSKQLLNSISRPYGRYVTGISCCAYIS